VLLDSIKLDQQSQDFRRRKWVAFADRENSIGDDQGSLAVIGPDGREKKLSSGWVSLQGVAWSPSGDEVWFTSTKSGSAQNLRGVSLSGKVRDITSVPGGMWLQGMRNGLALTSTHQQRIGIRGLPPGGVLFEEEGEGGGPNCTVFLRDTDGSPPVKIGEGRAEAISPDRKWVVTQSTQDTGLRLVPTGAGEARQDIRVSLTLLTSPEYQQPLSGLPNRVGAVSPRIRHRR
jgi:hypothetical protein